MPAQDLLTRILAFAAHVGRGESQSPEAVARRRNWITTDGEVTADGLSLLSALDDQRETRTVFRGNF
ncbi:hypothetical protein [Roseicyclus persicicus]|uniref:Uncharacterized protein n=1 Tax=Roseicyclus persicicus TaxID=2650661 RepID=A0A7X6JW72_9RHOB|nr:hypothetical protein [Roseibacterium persicicum]NKX43410.1 hypothetical protein [Roseibacterium persicicum]